MTDFIKSFLLKFKHNFWLKLLSLFLSFLVWIVVVAYYDPETTNMIRDIPIEIDASNSILEDQGLILVTDLTKTVDAKIGGKREKLALVNKDKVTAAVSVASVTKPGEYDLPVTISVKGQTVTTISQTVDYVTLKFEKSAKSQFSVEAVTKGKTDKNHVLEKTVNPAVVTVSGPESVVLQINTVQAIIEQDKFSESGVFEAKMAYLDKNGNKLDDLYLSLDVESVKVNVSVYEEKAVPLQLDIVNNSGGNDGAFLDVTIEPKTINIAGSAEALEEINSISLGTLDVSQIKEDHTESIALILPNGIKNIDAVENASVSIKFDGMTTKRFTISTSDIKIENLSAGTKASVKEGNIVLTVRGVSKDIERLKAKDIIIKADCKNQTLSKGSNIVSAYAVFPEGYKVGTVGKYDITLKVS